VTRALVKDHTDAIIAALEGFGLVVGDGKAPANFQRLLEDGDGYVVVYSIPGGGTSGNLDDPNADAVLVYQVTCVGKRRDQAELLADQVSELLQTELDVPGRDIPSIKVNMHGGALRDDSVTPPVFQSSPRFRIMSTPNGEES